VESKQQSKEITGSSNAEPEPCTVKSTGGLLKIPASRTGNWVKAFGGWVGVVADVHRSTGRNLGGGVLQLSVPNLSENSPI